jgi:hypothetical protein
MAKGNQNPTHLAAYQFKPGQTGNAGGRHKGVAEVAALARTYTIEAVETIVGIMRDESKSAQARLMAASLLLDRGYGKAPQALNISGASVLQVITGIVRAPDQPLLVTAETEGDGSPPDGVTH